jgi:hypothetical protein
MGRLMLSVWRLASLKINALSSVLLNTADRLQAGAASLDRDTPVWQYNTVSSGASQKQEHKARVGAMTARLLL